MNLTYVIAMWLIAAALMQAQPTTANDSPDSRAVRQLESVWKGGCPSGC